MRWLLLQTWSVLWHWSYQRNTGGCIVGDYVPLRVGEGSNPMCSCLPISQPYIYIIIYISYSILGVTALRLCFFLDSLMLQVLSGRRECVCSVVRPVLLPLFSRMPFGLSEMLKSKLRRRNSEVLCTQELAKIHIWFSRLELDTPSFTVQDDLTSRMELVRQTPYRIAVVQSHCNFRGRRISPA